VFYLLQQALGIQMELSVQTFFSIFVGFIFFVLGVYFLITGRMKTDPTGVNKSVVFSGIKARVMGLLLIILAFLISFIGFIT
jgi:hypothetical protein